MGYADAFYGTNLAIPDVYAYYNDHITASDWQRLEVVQAFGFAGRDENYYLQLDVLGTPSYIASKRFPATVPEEVINAARERFATVYHLRVSHTPKDVRETPCWCCGV